MPEPRPVLRLNGVEFSEAFVDEAVRRVGGQRITELVSSIPAGIENCDYLIGGHLLELKMIELEPLEVPERQEKLASLVNEFYQAGKKEAHLTGEAHLRFWRTVGSPVRRHLEKAAHQIRDTKALLHRPNLRGAVFLINCGGDSIDPDSLWNLATRHRRDFSADINAVMCFSAFPALAQDLNRPCLPFDYEHSGDGADEAFVKLFRSSFYSVFAEKLGKRPDVVDATVANLRPLRAPFHIDTPKGKITIF